MNHLAHCFLSFGDKDWLLGNFIGDYVKGNDWQDYPVRVQQGILLHRTIDSFTDTHPVVRQSIARVRPFAGKFAGPVTDILFDHLLVRAWNQYSSDSLASFTPKTYRQLEKVRPNMPVVLAERLPKMINGDFLQGYQHREGLEFVFSRFAKRLPLPVDYKGLLTHFFEELDAFDRDFQLFFPELLEKSKHFVENP
jgi:acyl carrier protein phosphodiesterase